MLQQAAGSKRGPPIPTSRLEPCCSNCGCPQTETPVMRKGPTGPLCNSCGCFYVKHRRMRDITKLANVGRGAAKRRRMLEEMRKAQESGASSHAATHAAEGQASRPLANGQAAAAVRGPGANAATAAGLALGPGAPATPNAGAAQRTGSAWSIPPLAPAMSLPVFRTSGLQEATAPVLAPGARLHAAANSGPSLPAAAPRTPLLPAPAVPGLGARAPALQATAAPASGIGASIVLPGVPLSRAPTTSLPGAQAPAVPGSAATSTVLAQPQTPRSDGACLAQNPTGSAAVPGTPLMQGLPLQVQAIPGSVGSAKVVLQLQALPNMPAVHSMTASLATRPQRRLPKQPSAPCTPGARLAAVAAAAECWDDELTWAGRCVSVPVPHNESSNSLADLLSDADFLADVDCQAAAVAASDQDSAVPAKQHGAGSELRQIFESFSADELELDWGELEEGFAATGRGGGRQSGALGSSADASKFGFPGNKERLSLPNRCGSSTTAPAPLVAPGDQPPAEDFEILPDVWDTGLGGAAPLEGSSSQQQGLSALLVRPSFESGPGTPLAAASSKHPPAAAGFPSGFNRGSHAAAPLPSSHLLEALANPAGCSSGPCGTAVPLGSQLEPSEVAEIPKEWQAILETGALLSGMHDMLS